MLSREDWTKFASLRVWNAVDGEDCPGAPNLPCTVSYIPVRLQVNYFFAGLLCHPRLNLSVLSPSNLTVKLFPIYMGLQEYRQSNFVQFRYISKVSVPTRHSTRADLAFNKEPFQLNLTECEVPFQLLLVMQHFPPAYRTEPARVIVVN